MALMVSIELRYFDTVVVRWHCSFEKIYAVIACYACKLKLALAFSIVLVDLQYRNTHTHTQYIDDDYDHGRTCAKRVEKPFRKALAVPLIFLLLMYMKTHGIMKKRKKKSAAAKRNRQRNNMKHIYIWLPVLARLRFAFVSWFTFFGLLSFD